MSDAGTAAAERAVADAHRREWAFVLAATARWPSPVAALNRAVAVSMVDGPATALAELDAVAADPRLAGYHYLPAIRADLLRRLDRPEEAVEAYQAALALVDNDAERAFLTTRLTEITAGQPG